MTYYVDVILPLALPNLFTYSLPAFDQKDVLVGMRVSVPFGKSKTYTGLIAAIHNQAPSLYQAKDIYQLIDKEPVVSKYQLALWEWIANYYCCHLGEVFRAAMPKTLMLESETLLKLKTHNPDLTKKLSDDAYLIWEALQLQPQFSVHTAAEILTVQKVYRILQELLQEGIIELEESVVETYKPKMVNYLRLHPFYETESALIGLLDSLSKQADKQKEALLYLFQWKAQHPTIPLLEKQLREAADVSKATLDNLIRKDILERYSEQQDRVIFEANAEKKGIQLNEIQNNALVEIHKHFNTKECCLLFGVTASGKTEVYKKLMEYYLDQGFQVLYLLPEIALTTQLVQRLTAYFGNRVAVYHSKYSSQERLEVWNHVLHANPEAQIVIGARSSVLLPFQHLGLIIVDEEHEPSYKQHDPAPRYHARDTALYLARLTGAKTILGSATPSIESYEHAMQNKYGMVMLNQRFGAVQMPKMEVVDLREAQFKKQLFGPFSKKLLEDIAETTNKGEQVILFQNRRGYAPILECTSCGHVPQCPHCDVTLTYHKFRNQLRCHYCGYAMAMPTHCHQCRDNHLTTKGLGTEQIELELAAQFPRLRIERLDTDTTRGKNSLETILDRFKNREIDVLIGTQMVAKGLDFKKVTLVGIIHADALWYQPDFRAVERCYQLLTQVSGRAGRAELAGRVLIQTHQPNHPIIELVLKGHYNAMFELQRSERQLFDYPPFCRLIRITLRHKNYDIAQQASVWLANTIKQSIDVPFLGPEEPPIARIRNEYHRTMMMKIPLNQSAARIKRQLERTLLAFESIAAYKSVKRTITVDPY